MYFYKPFKLIPKKNGKGYITSYTLNIGCKEARDLGLVDENGNPFIIKKDIVDNKLIVSKDFPNNILEFNYIFNNFGLKGKPANSETALELLHYIEGDSENYFNQLNNISDSLTLFSKLLDYRYQSKTYPGYLARTCCLIDCDENKIITDFRYISVQDPFK